MYGNADWYNNDNISSLTLTNMVYCKLIDNKQARHTDGHIHPMMTIGFVISILVV